MSIEDRLNLVATLRERTSPRTRNRHDRWRQLPKRTVHDVAERVIAREAKLARRAEAARKAGLLK